MGQYFIVVNDDKQEFINPHSFGDGLKFNEVARSAYGTLTALALLLRRSNEGGGGDFPGQRTTTIGSWAGDRISFVGDYDESGLYQTALAGYADVSHNVIRLMATDYILRREIWARGVLNDDGSLCAHPPLFGNGMERRREIVYGEGAPPNASELPSAIFARDERNA